MTLQHGDTTLALIVNAVMSAAGFLLCWNIIPVFGKIFIKANLFGVDMNKTSKEKVPEALGVVCGAVFLMVMFLFIPVPFYRHLSDINTDKFPHHEYVEYIAALLSICCMIFLGFADDVVELKWRHKLLLPTMASLPLLMVYFVNFNSTTIIVPRPLREIFGYDLNLGIFYYVYMGMLAVFCTNAINIMSGVNGLEVGQSWVMAISVLVHNFIELSGDFHFNHAFSMYFMMPFFGVCSALLLHNWYPSKVFVGDTFCYFAGMTFAVVAILGHFSKTMLLFFIPQVLNFIFSVPQLFKVVPCPRHRLPKYIPAKDKVGMSYAKFKKSELRPFGMMFIRLYDALYLIDVKYFKGDDGEMIQCSNFTINNLILKFLGPLHERTLVIIILSFQVFCNIIAFLIRYQLSRVFYDIKY